MSDLNYEKSRLMELKPETDEDYESTSTNDTSNELEIDPLADVKLFNNKSKQPKKNIEVVKQPPVQEKQVVDPEVKQPIVEKPKKQRKKRVLSAAHRAALERGRLKGLETRRKKKEEKMRLKQQKPIEKRVQIAEQKQQYVKPASNPEEEFKKFYSMMSRYEQIKMKKYQEYKKQQTLKLKKQQEILKKQKEIEMKKQQQQKKPVVKKQMKPRFVNQTLSSARSYGQSSLTHDYMKYFQ